MWAPPEMGVERRVLQFEWMLNCITVDIMLSFNIVTFVNTFQFKTVYRLILCSGTVNLQFRVKWNNWEEKEIFG